VKTVPFRGFFVSREFLWSVSCRLERLRDVRARREVVFWFVGLMMDESSFFVVQQANNFRRPRHQLFRVLFDGCLAAKFHPFLAILHFASSKTDSASLQI